MKHVAMALFVAGAVLIGTGVPATASIDVPMPVSHKATLQDYREVLRSLRRIGQMLDKLDAAINGSRSEKWQSECRGYSPEKTIRCAAVKFELEGGQEKAVSVWQCESGWGTEPSHSDAYHGPFQYAYSTYSSQQESMPNVVDWFELSPAVHDMRSNMLTAVAWASRHGWGPWPNCG